MAPEGGAVASVLAGGVLEKVPCGEFYIEQGLARRLVRGSPQAQPVMDAGPQPAPAMPMGFLPPEGDRAVQEWRQEQLEDLVLAAETLELDYLCVHSTPETDGSWHGARPQDVTRLVERGFFVFAFVDGAFGRLCRDWGFERTLAFAANRPDEARLTVLGLAREASDRVMGIIDAGAAAIIVGEDFAHDRGLLLHERLVAQVIFPELEHWVETSQTPVVLHCDGDISRVAASLPATGIAGLHSLERGANARFETYAALGCQGIALLGGLAHAVLGGDGDPAAAAMAAQELAGAFKGLPYVFGSSAGVLDDGLDPSAVLSAYAALRT